jgi:serine/threonine protein kinase
MRDARIPNVACFGPFKLDLKAGELQNDGQKLRLQEQPFRILEMLVDHPGEVVTREEIRGKLWPNDTVVEFDHSINAAIKKLRLALGDSAEEPRYVETVARRGYRLLLPVTWMDSLRVDGQAAALLPGPQPLAFARGNLIGRKVSHYRVLELLGGGGMGVVYKAEDIKLGRRVALKFLPEELANDTSSMGRFEREARAASNLNHPNICTIYEVEEHEGQPFIVMELLEGQTLRELIAATAGSLAGTSGYKGLLPLERLLEVAVQITEGLDAAHKKGIIHRDVKPANIFITTHGRAKILDFGLAKLQESDVVEIGARITDQEQRKQEWNPNFTLTRTGMAIGTAGYMSPEQVRGEKLDARTDLFSFGLVLYEMATGKRAFTGDTAPVLQKAILEQTPSPLRRMNPQLPAKLEKIVNKALEKDRQARYQSASKIRTELESIRETEQRRRSRVRGLAVGGVSLVLIVSTMFWIVKRPQSGLSEIKLRQLTFNSMENPVRGGAISPNGKYLAFRDAKGLGIKMVETGETRRVPEPEGVPDNDRNWEVISWFPDGTRFIVNSHRLDQPFPQFSFGSSSIWVVSLLGGPPQKLRDSARSFSISPDGTQISFGINRVAPSIEGVLGDREIWLMGPNGEQARKFIDADQNNAICCLSWLPGGKRISYITTDKSGDTLVTRELGGGPLTAILSPLEMKKSHGFSWSPDGRLIYDLQEPAPSQGQDTCNFWEKRVDLQSGGPIEKSIRLTKWTGFCVSPTSMTADGKRLAFQEWTDHFSAYFADLEANGTRITNTRRLTLSETWDFPEDWTADSKAVIFTSNRNGHWGIFKQLINEDSAEEIATGSSDATNPRLSPDGTRVIYMSAPGDPSAPYQIMQTPMSGGPSEPLFTARRHPDTGLICSKSPSTLCVIGEPLYDQARAQFIITAFDPQKGRGSELTKIDLDPKTQWRIWDFSPEGTRIAISKSPQGPIQILSLRGEVLKEIRLKGWSNLQDVEWAADGEGLFVANQVAEGIVLLHVDLLGNAHMFGQPRGFETRYSRPSPDGRHLALGSRTVTRNIWMIENF